MLIRFALLTRLPLDSDNALLKKCHGNIPAKTRIGYGTPPEGNFASFPNTTVNTTIVRNGRSNAHATPITVCLYRTSRSRQARK